MPLRNRAIIVLEADGNVGQFHLPGAESTNSLEREMLIGNRGQIIDELVDIAPVIGGDGSDRSGYNIDAGQGRDEFTLSFTNGNEKDYDPPLQWGDGSAGESKWDATGGHPQRKEQILQYYARISRTDSRVPGKLYWGDWSDGTFADNPGVFDSPMDVIVTAVTTDWENDSPSEFSGRVELVRTGSFPDIVPGTKDPTPDS